MSLVPFYKQQNRNVSGNNYIFLTEAENVSSVVVTGGEVSDIVMVGTTAFKQVQADSYSIRRTQSGGRSNKSFTNYQHRISFRCSKPGSEINILSYALDDAQPGGLIAIVMDGNGNGWLIGWSQEEENKRPLFLEENELDSGERPGDTDSSNHAFLLRGINDEMDLPMNDIINEYILDSIAAGDDLGFVP